MIKNAPVEAFLNLISIDAQSFKAYRIVQAPALADFGTGHRVQYAEFCRCKSIPQLADK